MYEEWLAVYTPENNSLLVSTVKATTGAQIAFRKAHRTQSSPEKFMTDRREGSKEIEEYHNRPRMPERDAASNEFHFQNVGEHLAAPDKATLDPSNSSGQRALDGTTKSAANKSVVDDTKRTR